MEVLLGNINKIEQIYMQCTNVVCSTCTGYEGGVLIEDKNFALEVMKDFESSSVM